MASCQCLGIETLFNREVVEKELHKYRQKGVKKTTKILIDALKRNGLQEATLLDIGGGIGEIEHEFMQNGLKSATSVEASSAYISAAKKEAQRRGHADRVTFRHGDFIDLADEIPPADVVTLDRVICCYENIEPLITLSAERARRFYGVVYPRELRWIKLYFALQNFMIQRSKNPFRMFVHPVDKIKNLIEKASLKQHFFHRTFFWEILIYERLIS